MNKQRFIVFITVICALMAIFSFNIASAQSEDGQSLGTETITIEPYAVLEDGAIVVEAYRMTENGLIKLNKEEYNQLKEESKKAEEKAKKLKNYLQEDTGITPLAFEPYFDYVYKQSGCIDPYYKYSLSRRISEVWKNTTESSMDHTFGCSTTQKYDINIGLSILKKNALSAAIGGSWSQSASFKSETIYKIPAGKYGWVKFIPIMKNSYGYMHYVKYISPNSYYTVSEEWTDLYIPRKLPSGNCDCLLECIVDSNPPNY